MVSLERQALMFQPAHLRPALRRGAVTYLLVFCMVVGAVTLYLLATATANTAMFAQQYPLLLALNGGLAACLATLLGYQLFKLRQKLKAGVFGAKLTLRLVILFALVAVLPGALVYGVSVQFVAKSIESWFDVRIEKALEIRSEPEDLPFLVESETLEKLRPAMRKVAKIIRKVRESTPPPP